MTLGITADRERRERMWRPNDQEQNQIVAGLLRLQKLPNPPFQAIWCERNSLRVREHSWEMPRLLRWADARALIAEREKPKPKLIVKQSRNSHGNQAHASKR